MQYFDLQLFGELLPVLVLVRALADPTEAKTQLHRRALLCCAVLIAGSAAQLRPALHCSALLLSFFMAAGC